MVHNCAQALRPKDSQLFVLFCGAFAAGFVPCINAGHQGPQSGNAGTPDMAQTAPTAAQQPAAHADNTDLNTPAATPAGRRTGMKQTPAAQTKATAEARPSAGAPLSPKRTAALQPPAPAATGRRKSSRPGALAARLNKLTSEEAIRNALQGTTHLALLQLLSPTSRLQQMQLEGVLQAGITRAEHDHEVLKTVVYNPMAMEWLGEQMTKVQANASYTTSSKLAVGLLKRAVEWFELHMTEQ